MNDTESFLYSNMQKLFYGLNIGIKTEDIIDKNTSNDRLDIYFNELRTKIKEQKGGNLIIPLNTLKQYINNAVNNITPK
jgi:hypothetical protein